MKTLRMIAAAAALATVAAAATAATAGADSRTTIGLIPALRCESRQLLTETIQICRTPSGGLVIIR